MDLMKNALNQRNKNCFEKPPNSCSKCGESYKRKICLKPGLVNTALKSDDEYDLKCFV